MSSRARPGHHGKERQQNRLSVIAPARHRGDYLHLHGGGWLCRPVRICRSDASARMPTTRVRPVCRGGIQAGAEHTYPAGPDDCESRWRFGWCRTARRSSAPTPGTIGGESEGGQPDRSDDPAACGTATAIPGVPRRQHRERRPLISAYHRSRQFGLPRRRLVLRADRYAAILHAFLPTITNGACPLSPRSTPISRAVPGSLQCRYQGPRCIDDTLFMASALGQAGNVANWRSTPAERTASRVPERSVGRRRQQRWMAPDRVLT